VKASATFNTFAACLVFEERSSILCIDASSDFILEVASRDSDRDIEVSSVVGIDGCIRTTRRVRLGGWDIGVDIATVPRRLNRTRKMQQRSGMNAFPVNKQTIDISKRNKLSQEAIGIVD
jgi:hypothetical protein